MNIGVFCSQYDVAEKYTKDAEKLARLIGEGGHSLIWGGADEGMMGLIASTAKVNGSKIIGVMREILKTKAKKDADEMHIVSNAYEMNLGIIERSDVIIALTGGIRREKAARYNRALTDARLASALQTLARLGAQVTGLDPAPTNVKVAQAHADAEGVPVDYRARTIEDVVAGGERFESGCELPRTAAAKSARGASDFPAEVGSDDGRLESIASLVRPGRR